jgi:exodeoxyribonuclease VII large subunit
VIPDERELRERLDATRANLARGAGMTVERARNSLARDRERLSRAPALLVERKRAGLEALAGRLQALSPQKTLARGYAIVRTDNGIVRSSSELAVGARVEVELGEGGFGGRVEETRP